MLDRTWNACLVGVGRLGRAIISYPGFAPEGFKIVSAFYMNPAVVGTTVDGISAAAISEIKRVVERLGREGSKTLSIVDRNGTVTEQYVWEWIKADGSLGKIDLSFLDGTLEDKSYKG